MQKNELVPDIHTDFPELSLQEWETCDEPHHERGSGIEKIADNWEDKLGCIIEGLTSRLQMMVSIEGFKGEILALKSRCEILERTSPLIVPIESLAPEPYEVVHPFHVVVRLEDEQYIASFFDANLSASGDTYAEAVSNLKDIIVGTLEILDGIDENELGPGPLQQKQVLEEFVQRKA